MSIKSQQWPLTSNSYYREIGSSSLKKETKVGKRKITPIGIDPTAKQIHFFLIYIPCMAAPQKYSFVGLDTPSAKTAGNYLYYEQSYDDVLLFESKHEGLAFVIEA